MKKKSLVIRSFPQLNILKIPNNFLRASYKCSATTQRMYFYSIFKYITSQDNKNEVTFSFSDFFNDLNLRDGEKTRNLIKDSATDILDMKMVLEDNEKQFEAINVFQSAKCVFTETTFSFKFTEPMKIFLDELREIGFSLFALDDLGKLKSFYALRYYLIALSFKGFKGKKGNIRNTWFFEYTVEDLRRLFDIQEDEYPQMGPFKKIVIDSPLKELNEKNLGIQITCTPIKKGRRIVAFHFDCVDSKKIDKVDGEKNFCLDYGSQDDGTEFEDEVKIMAEGVEIISKDPVRYAQILEEERMSPSLFGISPEVRAIVRLRDELSRDGEKES